MSLLLLLFLTYFSQREWQNVKQWASISRCHFLGKSWERSWDDLSVYPIDNPAWLTFSKIHLAETALLGLLPISGWMPVILKKRLVFFDQLLWIFLVANWQCNWPLHWMNQQCGWTCHSSAVLSASVCRNDLHIGTQMFSLIRIFYCFLCGFHLAFYSAICFENDAGCCETSSQRPLECLCKLWFALYDIQRQIDVKACWIYVGT